MPWRERELSRLFYLFILNPTKSTVAAGDGSGHDPNLIEARVAFTADNQGLPFLGVPETTKISWGSHRELSLLSPPIHEHGIDLVPVPGNHLGPLAHVLRHQLGSAVHERLLQHHLHEIHGAGVDQTDPETVSHQPGQAVQRTLNTGTFVAGAEFGFTTVPA